jgi:tryptophanyl-tRNA synthetase
MKNKSVPVWSNIFNEARTGLNGEFKDMLLEVLPEELQDYVEQAEILQNEAQQIEEHYNSAVEWLRDKASFLPDFSEEKEKYERKINEMLDDAEEKADEIADETAEKINQVVPENLRLEDTCL